MTDSERSELTAIRDELAAMRPIVEALGGLLIRQHDAGQALGLHPNTIYQNKSIAKLEEIGHRRTFIEVGSVAVLQQRKRTRRRTKK